MKPGVTFEALYEHVYKISKSPRGLAAYLIETSYGVVLINSIPELFKSYFNYLPVHPRIICITSPTVGTYGDNYTGIEFVLWTYKFFNQDRNLEKLKIVGLKENLDTLRKRLSISMKGDFQNDKSGNENSLLVNTNWAEIIVDWVPVENTISLQRLMIRFPDKDSIMIHDGDCCVFNSKSELTPTRFSLDLVSPKIPTIVNSTIHTSRNTDALKLTVIGNGVATRSGTTSSFFVEFSDTKILIDIPAYYKEKLDELCINRRSITHYVISHLHEDHVEGFSELIFDFIHSNTKLHLVTAKEIYSGLLTMYQGSFDLDISSFIDFTDIEHPDSSSVFGKLYYETRRNYHPIEALGFKFASHNKLIGISGDTLYDPHLLNCLLENETVTREDYEKLQPSWFQDSSLILHETTIYKDKVHTKLKNLEYLSNQIPSTAVYAYHYSAHSEGNYFATQEMLNELEEHNQVAFRYCELKGKISTRNNPNGSMHNIAGIFNREKNVLGLMPHPERAVSKLLGSNDGLKILTSMVISL
ncbi:hypothetical protein CHS0354_023862 [Potamilus streckersoni]|uniref:Phosphoribosylformylglycinamidine synthase n=1 Tax=Potamilus streckersoni TaxID=2493646 RepID=A0AAE0RYZ7_9BIVA|nr:hypothetical protein CHS0354_023862 [Potamilus streckersoni]